MKRLFSALWRWALILLTYLLLGVPVVGLVLPGAGGQTAQLPMLLQRLLDAARTASGFFPDYVYYADWKAFVSAYAMNCLFLSLFLLALWNLAYAPFALGRNRENTARTVIWGVVAAHVILLLAYAFYVFTLAPYVWEWLTRQPTGLALMLLLPGFLVVPFYLSARALCPYRVYTVFPLFARLREPLRLRVYSRRGPR